MSEEADFLPDKGDWHQMAWIPIQVFQPVAVELGLTFNECALLSWLRKLKSYPNVVTMQVDGIPHYWMAYSSLVNRVPLMGIESERSMIRLVAGLVSKGVITKYVQNDLIHKRRAFLAVNPKYESFLFATAMNTADVDALYEKWQRLQKGEEMVDLFAKAEDSKPAKALSEDFLWFLHELKGKTKFNVNRYDKDGKPFKTVLKLQEMYEALLDGSFVQKFAPASKTYDFSTIGPVTEAEILKVAASAPDYIDTINTLFIHYKTKRSELLESVHRIRNYTPPVVKREPPDPEDTNFAGFIDIVKEQNPNFKWDEERLAGAWNLHKWYKQNYKDVQEMNVKDQKNEITAGLYKMGTSFGSFTAKNRTWIPRYEDFHVDSKFWKSYAAFSLKFRGGVKILLDEGFYRRKAKEEVQRELLYESRTIEEELGGGRLDYLDDY